MRNSFLKQKSSLFLAAVMSVLLYAPVCPAAMTMDEVLDYSVKDLQSRMRELTGNNASLRQKTDSLRNRILFLRQEMRVLDNRKIQLMEAAAVIKDSLKGDTRQEQIGKDRLKQVRQKKANLKKEQSAMSTYLAHIQDQQKAVQLKVGDMEKQLSLSQTEQQRAGEAWTRQMTEQKQQLWKRIAESKDRIKKADAQIRLLQNRNQGIVQQKDSLLQAGQALREQLLMSQDELQAANDKEKEFAQASQKLAASRQSRVEQGQQDVEDLQQAVDQVTQSIQVFAQTRDSILGAAVTQQKDLVAIKTALIKQKQILVEQEAVAVQGKGLAVGLVKKQDEHKQNLVAQEKTVQEQLQKLKSVLPGLKEHFAAQQQKQQAFLSEEKQLVQDLQALQDKVEAGKKGALGAGILEQKKRELAKSIAQQAQKNQDRQKEYERLTRNSGQNAKQLEIVKAEKSSLIKTLAERKAGLEQMETAAKEFQKNVRSSQSGKQENLKKLQAELQDLEYRKAALASSLAVIEERYDVEAQAVKDFQKQESQLNGYMTTLQIENQGLRQKERELLSTQKALPNVDL